jgi:hypothetical protein
MNTGNEPPVPAEQPEQGPGPRPRDARGNFIPIQAAAEKAAAAARLKAANPRMTYQQIADTLGYSSKGDAWRAVQRCRDAVLESAGAEVVASEAQELDDLYVMAMEVIEANHVVVSHGKVITMLDPETGEEKPLADSGPKLQAIQTALRIRESYRKLRGVDQPQQVAVSGSVKYEVVGVDPADLG